MIIRFLEASGLYRNGRLDTLRLLLAGLPLVLFMLWRLSSHGVYGADQILRALERELLLEYKAAQYEKGDQPEFGYAVTEDGRPLALELDELEVRFTNVSMSGSLFSWSANDPVGIRFDYTIERQGLVKASARNVYRCTHRQSRTSFWECGLVSYYMKYF